MAARTSKGSRAGSTAAATGVEVRSACTIVDGRRERRVHASADVPIGIEKVLYLAATDDAFRRRLLADRSAALRTTGVRLTGAERDTLQAIPTATLDTMIRRLRPAQHGKRRLMRTVAAATVSLAAGIAAAGGCVEGDDDGDTVDTAPMDIYENYADGGIDPGETWDDGWEPPDAAE